MKLSIDNYKTLDITVRWNNEPRATMEALTSWLNEVSIVYQEAGERALAMGGEATARDYFTKAENLYKFCKAHGAYNGR